MNCGQEFKRLYKNPKIVLDNLSKVYNKCLDNDLVEGKSWYENANSFSLKLSEHYSVSPMVCAGVIAAMSPMKNWEDNKIIAEEIIKTSGRRGKHFQTQIQKARKILFSNSHSEIEIILNGLKTVNFFNNIHNPKSERHVTVDRHHLYLSIGRDVKYCTTKQYEFLKEITCIFAKEKDLIPSELQSILWVCWRRIKKE